MHLPWNELTLRAGIERAQISVAEETADDHSVSGDYSFDEQIINEVDTWVTGLVDYEFFAKS
ncbi:MAG: hypothetical protein NXH94_15185 [Rhodobacteraceae bacterium]|jgi:hypothetical protein|uniref:hypothetical protein n=1 Tax=Marivita sp. TaxID=2003365 RepID=UPI003B515DB7|nr:hypothetical protein [Paracoccaceae bacterium]